MDGQQLFHVLLDGKQVGPYDRRTILGMRVKKALLPGHVLLDSLGNRLTVEDLVGEVGEPSPSRPAPLGTLTFAATFRSVRGRGHGIPAFQGQVEVRVQADVLRIAGRYRKGLGWKEDRVKLPMGDVQHANASGTEVDVALAGQGNSFQWVTLSMDSEAAAREFAASLPVRDPMPELSAATGGEGLLAPLAGLLRRK